MGPGVRPSSGGPVKRGSRKTISCESCRARKVRCSRQSPCENCIKRGEPCIWKADAHPSAPAAPKLYSVAEVAGMRKALDVLAMRFDVSQDEVEELVASCTSAPSSDHEEEEPERHLHGSPPSLLLELPSSVPPLVQSGSATAADTGDSTTPDSVPPITPPTSGLPGTRPSLAYSMPATAYAAPMPHPMPQYWSRGSQDGWLSQPQWEVPAMTMAATHQPQAWPGFTLPQVQTPSQFRVDDFDFGQMSANGQPGPHSYFQAKGPMSPGSNMPPWMDMNRQDAQQQQYYR